MAKYFLESSAFVKRYRQESGSPFVNRLFQEKHELFYLNLALLEIRKVFFRLYKWPQGLEGDVQITREEFQNLEAQFAADLLTMKRIEFTDEMLEKSTEILKHAWIRSVFDLAQLSSFLVAKEIYSDLVFVCSDKRSNLIEATKFFVNRSNIVIPEYET